MFNKTDAGKRMKKARESLKLTQKTIAEQANITIQGYLNYEKGKRIIPADLLDIYFTFGIDVNWLLTGEGEMFLSQEKTNKEEPTDEAVSEVARLMTNMDEQGKQAVLQTARQAERIARLEKKLAG